MNASARWPLGASGRDQAPLERAKIVPRVVPLFVVNRVNMVNMVRGSQESVSPWVSASYVKFRHLRKSGFNELEFLRRVAVAKTGLD